MSANRSWPHPGASHDEGITFMFANTLYRLLGHRICCGCIPDWTARVGQKWDTYDQAPLNLYNVLWRIQQRIRRHVS
jgi:hypothetical protein